MINERWNYRVNIPTLDYRVNIPTPETTISCKTIQTKIYNEYTHHPIDKTKHSVCLFLLSILHKPCHTVRIQASFINGIKSISWRAKAAAKSLYTCIFNYLSKYSIRFLFHFGESLPTGEDALFVYCMYWAAVRFFCVSAIQYLRQRK